MNSISDLPNGYTLVVTESEFRAFLRRGYVGEITTGHDSVHPQFEPIHLVHPSNRESKANAITRPDRQLGQPVFVSWNSDVLTAVKDRIVEADGGDCEVHALLPLLQGCYIAAFSDSEREKNFRLELRNETDGVLEKHLCIGGLEQESAREPTTDGPQPLPLGYSDITQETYATAMREDRLQSASELLAASEASARHLELVRAVTDPVVHNFATSTARDLHEVRWGRTDHQSLLSVATEYILSLDARRSLSPLSEVERSDLVLKLVTASHRAEPDYHVLENLLYLVRSGEGLHQLLSETSDPSLQGLIIFMSHNRDPRDVANLNPIGFENKTEALAVCAFLTGLRYHREQLPLNLVWDRLRVADILDFTERVNNRAWDFQRPGRVTVLDEHGLTFNGYRYTRPKDVFTIELATNRRGIWVETKNGFDSHPSAAKLVITSPQQVSTCKRRTLEQVKEDQATSFIQEIFFAPSKKPTSQIMKVFANRKVDNYIKSTECVVLKIQGAFWIELTDGQTEEYADAMVWVRIDSLSATDPNSLIKAAPKQLQALILNAFRPQKRDVQTR